MSRSPLDHNIFEIVRVTSETLTIRVDAALDDQQRTMARLRILAGCLKEGVWAGAVRRYLSNIVLRSTRVPDDASASQAGEALKRVDGAERVFLLRGDGSVDDVSHLSNSEIDRVIFLLRKVQVMR